MQAVSFLARIPQLFRGRRLRRQIGELELELLTAEATQRAVLLTHLSDLHAELGDERAAAGCLGTAIDSCLAVGHLESAAALCRKMLTAFPSVVRAHGTLGFLLMARGSYREAEWELARYLKASREDGTASYAVERLRMTAPAFAMLEARLILGRLLRQVGSTSAADHIEQLNVPEMSAPEQRRHLASLLRRSVRAHLMRPGDAPATVRLDHDEHPDHDGAELPLLDTSVLRSVQAPARTAPAAPLLGEDWDDLPWMDTALPNELSGAEPEAAEPTPARAAGAKRGRRRSRAA
jgi:hypothetical protein